MASSVALGRPRWVDWHPKHFHTVCLGGTHPYHVLGPLTRPLRHSQGPQKGPFWPFWGPRRSLGSPGGPDLGPSATGWSNWVGRIHIMCLGPLRDLYSTPGAPKRARFGPESPFWGPRRSLGSHGGPNLGPSATGWSNWVGRIHTMCLGPLRDLCGTPGAPIRARFGPESPFLGPQRSSGSPGELDLVPAATGWSNWEGRIHCMRMGPVRYLYSLLAPKKGPFWPK